VYGVVINFKAKIISKALLEMYSQTWMKVNLFQLDSKLLVL
jgi:hypothetical protein